MNTTLTEGSIGKQLLKFFFPIMFGTFFQQLYNTVDAIVVGRFVGSNALAAVGGSAGMIVNLIVGFFVGLTAGASVIVSQFFGSGDREKVSKSLHTIYAFSIIGSFVISAVGYFVAPQLLKMMSTPAEIYEDSLLYLRVFLLGIVFMFIYNTGSALLRALGDSKRPLIYLIICCMVNIVLDILFVAVFQMGVLGAALATIIALAISSVLVTRALVNSKELCDFSIKEIRIDGDTLKRQIYIGFPGGVQSSMVGHVVVVRVDGGGDGCNGRAAADARAGGDQVGQLPVQAQRLADKVAAAKAGQQGKDHHRQGHPAHMQDGSDVQRQAQQNDGEFEDLLGGELQSGGKHIRLTNELVEEHADEHGDDRRADQVNGQQTLQPAGQQRHDDRQHNAGKQLHDLHGESPLV